MAFPWMWLVLSLCCVALCVAPKHIATSVAASAAAAATSGSIDTSGAAVGSAVVGAAAAAAWLLLRKTASATQPHLDASVQSRKAPVLCNEKGKESMKETSKEDNMRSSHRGEHSAQKGAGDSDHDEDEEGLLQLESSSGEESEGEEQEADGSNGGSSSNAGKLWTAKQFPEGMNGAKNWDIDNLLKAQEWECPCEDRVSCISADRIPITELGWHRKDFRLRLKKVAGGLRDGCRREMQAHYDKATSSFTRSFVIGPKGDCCVAAMGLAKGLCFGTFASARADVTQPNRPWHKDRVKQRGAKLSAERAHLMAYIRKLKKGFEGPKGGSDPNAKFKTAYVPVSKRWSQYERYRRQRSLPIIGSKALFAKLWAEQDEIVEESSCGHGKCNTCGDLDSQEDTYSGRHDEEAKKQLQRIARERELHNAEHLGERACATFALVHM